MNFYPYMFQFPGEENIVLVMKNNQPLHKEPLPLIGSVCTCEVHKATPSHLYLHITHIEDKKTIIKYKATLKAQDFRANVDENTFLDDFYKRADIFKALIISFGDHCGCYVSTLSDQHGIVLNKPEI